MKVKYIHNGVINFMNNTKEGIYKNNNGNYSLRLVPIHRSQPKLIRCQTTVILTGCFTGYEILFCNPRLLG